MAFQSYESTVPNHIGNENECFKCLPSVLKDKLAMHLEGKSASNCEALALALGIEIIKYKWCETLAQNSKIGSPTLIFFDRFCEELQISKVLDACKRINNIPCTDILEVYLKDLSTKRQSEVSFDTSQSSRKNSAYRRYDMYNRSSDNSGVFMSSFKEGKCSENNEYENNDINNNNSNGLSNRGSCNTTTTGERLKDFTPSFSSSTSRNSDQCMCNCQSLRPKHISMTIANRLPSASTDSYDRLTGSKQVPLSTGIMRNMTYSGGGSSYQHNSFHNKLPSVINNSDVINISTNKLSTIPTTSIPSSIPNNNKIIKVFITYYAKHPEDRQKVLKVCSFLKSYNVKVSVDTDFQNTSQEVEKAWVEGRFECVDFVLVLVTPSYKKAIRMHPNPFPCLNFRNKLINFIKPRNNNNNNDDNCGNKTCQRNIRNNKKNNNNKKNINNNNKNNNNNNDNNNNSKKAIQIKLHADLVYKLMKEEDEMMRRNKEKLNDNINNRTSTNKNYYVDSTNIYQPTKGIDQPNAIPQNHVQTADLNDLKNNNNITTNNITTTTNNNNNNITTNNITTTTNNNNNITTNNITTTTNNNNNDNNNDNNNNNNNITTKNNSKRFISLFLPGSSKRHAPKWLRDEYPNFEWPDQWKEILDTMKLNYLNNN